MSMSTKLQQEREKICVECHNFLSLKRKTEILSCGCEEGWYLCKSCNKFRFSSLIKRCFYHPKTPLTNFQKAVQAFKRY